MLYISIKAAVYRHEVLGIFDDLEKAIQASTEALLKERDDHHHFVIAAGELNQGELDGLITVATVTREDHKTVGGIHTWTSHYQLETLPEPRITVNR